MIEKLTDYLLKRRLKKSKISVDILADKPSAFAATSAADLLLKG